MISPANNFPVGVNSYTTLGAIYNAGDVVDHSLIARKKVFALKNDLYTVLREIKPKETIGVVYSWVGGDGVRPLHWMFQDGRGGYYYVKHEPGAFDIDALSKELAVDGKYDLETRAEQAEEERKKAEMGAFAYYFEKYGKTVLVAVVGVVVFKEIMRSGSRR